MICENATLSASGGSGGTIYWQGTSSGGTSTSGGSGANSPAITTTGTYYARAESDGCWGDEGSDSVSFKCSPTGVSASASASEVFRRNGELTEDFLSRFTVIYYEEP